MKTLLGERVLVLPDNSDDTKTAGGIIIPIRAKYNNNQLKSGVICRKGTGTPWNKMENLHVKQRVLWKDGAGQPHEEDHEGVLAKYLIINAADLFLE